MRERVLVWSTGALAGTWGRVLASDPGLSRLRTAVTVAVSLASAIVVELGFAWLLGAPSQTRVVMLLVGAIVALIGGMALSGTGLWTKVRTAAFFPVALGVGVLTGSLVQGRTLLLLGMFVVMTFLAVFVRRFGLPFFFYGFLGWIGFFFASFLHATPGMVPGLVGAAAIASAWVLLLSVTVLRTDPAKVLAATMGAFGARVRATSRACADLLEAGEGESARQRRVRRRLAASRAAVTEAALMAEAWSEEHGALPPGWSGPALRRRLLDAQQAAERVVGATYGLLGGDARLVSRAVAVLDSLGREQDAATRRQARELYEWAETEAAGVHHPGDPGDPAAPAAPDAPAEEAARGRVSAARHLAVSVLEYLDIRAERDVPPEVDPVDSFDAAASLMMGNLPGSSAVAGEVRARGFRWNPLPRLEMTTRQAFQVALAAALAIALGWQLSPQRYYWAVIAAFVTFTGTGTRSEVFLKGWNRVLGTLLGLAAAIVLAHLTIGHTPWILAVVLACVFLGFYLVRVSYAAMIFFITIMLGQLYALLGMFSDGLLVLRLEETVIGAVAGVVVALVVTPLSTRDTVRSARDGLLESLALLLEEVVAALEPTTGRGPDLDGRARELDDHARRMQLVARPLTSPLLGGSNSPWVRHRLGLYLAAVAQARALSVAVRARPTQNPDAVRSGCTALATAARQIAETPLSRRAEGARQPLERGDHALYAGRSGPEDPTLRILARMHATLGDLAVQETGPGTEREGEGEQRPGQVAGSS